MQTILDMLKRAGGWHPGLYLKIDNAPFMELVIEAVDESGPCGSPALSVAHYGEQNGDAMRDPEMLFEVEADGSLNPFYWRNDYIGVEQWSRFGDETGYVSRRELFIQHVSFARVWDRNLQSQGYLEAFDPQKHTRG